MVPFKKLFRNVYYVFEPEYLNAAASECFGIKVDNVTFGPHDYNMYPVVVVFTAKFDKDGNAVGHLAGVIDRGEAEEIVRTFETLQIGE